MTPPAQSSENQEKRRARLILLITTVLFSSLLVPAYHAGLAASLIFAAPEEQRYASLTAFGIALISYPVVTVPAVLAAWLFYYKKRYRTACYLGLLPTLPLLAILASFLLLEA